MRRFLQLTPLLVLFLLCGLIVHAQEKKEPPPKGVLPAKWKDLGLTDAQKKDVYATQDKYNRQIDEFEEKIKKLRTDRDADLIKILTDEQKKRLRELKDPIPPEKGSTSASSSKGS